MVIPNEFLLSIVVHDNIIKGCFCGSCRNERVLLCSRHSVAELFTLFRDMLPFKCESRLDKYHEDVLKSIVTGKVYKDSCLENTGYQNFKSWAKNQATFADWTPGKFNKFCVEVNEACNVFEHWEQIVRNLTDPRMDQIDARRFSVNYFNHAKRLDWCLSYNELIRNKAKCRGGDEPLYPTDKYNAIFQNILASGILDDIEHDPRVASMIGGRLQAEIVSRCRTRYRPY